MVRFPNRTYRAWRTTKLTPMVRLRTAHTESGEMRCVVNKTYANVIQQKNRHLEFCEQHLERRFAEARGPRRTCAFYVNPI